MNPETAGKVFFNFKLPTHCCFAVAVADRVDEATATWVRTTNPFGNQVDLMWYEVPVLYSLSQGELYFYEKAANLLENFRGEIVWKKLREIVEKLLLPGVNVDEHSGAEQDGGDNNRIMPENVGKSGDLTESQKRRLEAQRQRKQEEWELVNDKLGQLRKALAIEAGAAVKFQLQQQINLEEATLAQLSAELEEIEKELMV